MHPLQGMQTPLQVTFHNLPHSTAVEEFIRTKAEKLEQFCDRITSCKVAVEAPHHHQTKGNEFHVRVEVVVPGEVIVIDRDPGEREAHSDVYIAIRDAFRVAARQVEDYVRVRRDAERAQPAH